MTNAWSLLYDELKMTEHSTYYYEYDRNDPNRKSPDGFEIENDGVVGAMGEDHITFNLEIPKSFSSPPKIKFKEVDNNNGRWRYHEDVILNDIKEYVSDTYNSHYTSEEPGFNNIQTIDLMAAKGLASGFCQSNIIKYGSRYGDKDGKSKKDLLKVIHYAMLLLHFDDHYKVTKSDFPY
jgi:hypothetical protein